MRDAEIECTSSKSNKRILESKAYVKFIMQAEAISALCSNAVEMRD